jgi:hypothetical protein
VSELKQGEGTLEEFQFESAYLGCKRTTMGKTLKKEWIQEVEEINQSI